MAKGGARKGTGPKKGSHHKKTLERLEYLKKFKDLGAAAAQKLFRIQMMVADGTHRMVVVTKGKDGIPKVETVRDEKRMDKLLTTGVYGKDYLILAGREPNAQAANLILDRTFGSAVQSLDLDPHDKAEDTFNDGQLLKIAQRIVDKHGKVPSQA